jgi:hypothetical protein
MCVTAEQLRSAHIQIISTANTAGALQKRSDIPQEPFIFTVKDRRIKNLRICDMILK